LLCDEHRVLKILNWREWSVPRHYRNSLNDDSLFIIAKYTRFSRKVWLNWICVLCDEYRMLKIINWREWSVPRHFRNILSDDSLFNIAKYTRFSQKVRLNLNVFLVVWWIQSVNDNELKVVKCSSTLILSRLLVSKIQMAERVQTKNPYLWFAGLRHPVALLSRLPLHVC